MNNIYVVFGATGALGSAIVRRLVADGKPVRAVVRDIEGARRLLPNSSEIIACDAMKPDSVIEACRDSAVIYHCINVAYQKWPVVMPVVTDNILAAAHAMKARLLFPGNVYNYGPFQKIPATEDHPLAATSKKGKLRIELERNLMDAHRKGDVSVVIPRFPDYFGPNVTNKLMAPIFQAALAGKKASWFGKLDVLHDFVFIDDAAATCALLSAKADAYGQTWHVPGAGPITGRQFIELAFTSVGVTPKVGAMGRSFLQFVGLFAPEAREMVELMYEFEKPLVLDGSKFAHTFPSFRYTPHEEAVRQTAQWFRQYRTG